MSLHLPLAGIGSRFLALLLDTLIQFALGIALLVAAGMVAASDFADLGLWGVAAFYIGVFLLMYGYFILFEVVWNGQTPGKRAVGIRVIKESGRPLTVPETIGRNLLRIVDQLPGFYAIGLVVALLNKQHKRLGDMVAGSILVRETNLAEMKPLWHTEAPPPLPTGTAGPMGSMGATGASALTVDDLKLIDTFLGRRYSLPADVRVRMADQILNRVAPRLNLRVDRSTSPESILEAAAYERRSAG